MFKNGITLCALALMVSTGWSDEPVPARKPLQQRVSPKVLREAMALPEYQGQEPESPALLLVDLDRLAQKLKKDGDTEGADLLQQFIVEHRRLVKQTAKKTADENEIYHVHVKIIELNLDDLSRDHFPHLIRFRDHNQSSTDNSNDARRNGHIHKLFPTTGELTEELQRLIAANKVKVLHRFEVITRSGNPATVSAMGHFPITIPHGDSRPSTEFQEFGTTLEALPTSVGKERVKLVLTSETSDKDTSSAVTIDGTTVPGLSKRRFQSTLELDLNETQIQPLNSHGNTNRWTFIVTKVNHAE